MTRVSKNFISLSLNDGTNLAGMLDRHRDHYFRRIPSRRVTGEKTAVAFIEETGFCTAFTAGLGVPCLREAIEGRREPKLPLHIQHDPAIIMTWRLKDRLPGRKAVYYGKAIGGRPSFIALPMLPAFLWLHLAPGGYRRLYERGLLSSCARLVMETLKQRGPTETRALKLASGFSQPKKRAAFDRAMKELQEKFLALKVEERYDPFTYVWDTLEHRWTAMIRKARGLTAAEAAYRIVRRYFEIAGFGSECTIGRILGIEPRLIDLAARRLEREGVLRRGLRIENFRQALSVLSERRLFQPQALRTPSRSREWS